MRWGTVLAVVVGGVLLAEVLFSGCAYTQRRVVVMSHVVDEAGAPVAAAEVYYVSACVDSNEDLAWIREQDDQQQAWAPELRERWHATTDSKGRFALVIALGEGRGTGPIANMSYYIFGGGTPSFRNDRILVKAEGFRERIGKIERGAWVKPEPNAGVRWVYEMPAVRMEAESR